MTKTAELFQEMVNRLMQADPETLPGDCINFDANDYAAILNAAGVPEIIEVLVQLPDFQQRLDFERRGPSFEKFKAALSGAKFEFCDYGGWYGKGVNVHYKDSNVVTFFRDNDKLYETIREEAERQGVKAIFQKYENGRPVS